MSNRAWVTLATNDSYGLGALVLAHSLRRVGSAYPSVVLITPSVTEPMRDRLRAVFAEVVIVDVLDSRDATHLALLQRPELGITFTKIHCWGLTQYEKCVFLDADTLIVQNCDELFEREELSAAPDVGWPDCFNSGVFVYKPSAETFDKLIKFAQERGSFDGGDQGLLNSFFSDWARGDINKHLPFLYNVTSAAFYSYLPALKHYGQNIKIIHFIGSAKPWLQQYNFQSRSVDAPEHLREFLQLWWDLFVSDVHSKLDESMSGVAGNLARVVAGVGAPREALDELTRRQGWEAGNIDYMGADSFDNIWAKISQTLNQTRISPPKQPSPPKETAPPKEPSPPKEQPAPAPVELAQEAIDATAPAPMPAPVPAPVEPPVAVEAPIVPEASAAVEAAAPAEVPVIAEAPVEVPVTAKAPAAADAPAAVKAPAATEAPKVEPAPIEIPATIEQSAVEAPPAAEIPATVETPAGTAVSVEPPAVEEAKKTEEPVVPLTPPTTPKSTPEASTPESTPIVAQESVPVTVESPKSPPAAEAAKPEVTPEKSEAPSVTDSPPLANTPSKEEVPSLPAAKSTEEAAQETRL